MKTHHRYLTIVAALTASLLPALPAAEEKVANIEEDISIEVESPWKAEHAKKEPVTFLGLEVMPAPEALAAQLRLPPGQGLVVRFVLPDSPAEAAGLQKHDVLLRLDDQILIEPRQLSILVRNRREGETVSLHYVRAGAEATAKATLTTRRLPDRDFRWKHAAPHGMHFEGDFDRILPEDFSERMHELGERMKNLRIEVPTPMPMPKPRPGEPHVMIFPPRANIVLSDEEGELRIKTVDGDRMLIARDAEGQELFSGPIDTKEQRAALTPDLLRRLQRLEGMEVLPPEPPPPPARPMPGLADESSAVTL